MSVNERAIQNIRAFHKSLYAEIGISVLLRVLAGEASARAPGNLV
jgi:hypothetical protein